MEQMKEQLPVGTQCPPCETAPKSEFCPETAAPSSLPTSFGSSPAAQTPAPGNPYPFADRVFAPLFYLLGVGFVYTFFFSASTAAFTVFTAAYLAVLLLFARRRGAATDRRLLVWPLFTGLLGLTFLYDNVGTFAGVRILILIGLAGYSTLAVFGGLADKKTSAALPADLLRCFFIFPFGHFFDSFGAVAATIKNRKGCKRHLGGVGLGLALSIPLLFLIIPLLCRADALFGALLNRLIGEFAWNFKIGQWVFCFVFGLPVGLYLFGLCRGAALSGDDAFCGRRWIDARRAKRQVLPVSTIVTALLVLSGVYLLFIGFQAQILFGAFSGVFPAGFDSYSAYARQGFFELCRVAAINLCILTGARLFCRKPVSQSSALRRAEWPLCLLTFCLIASAAGRMLLYISAYGLTIKRVCTLLILAFLALVFALVLVSQKRALPITQIASVVLAAGFVAFALSAPQMWIDRYNTALGYLPQIAAAEQADFER